MTISLAPRTRRYGAAVACRTADRHRAGARVVGGDRLAPGHLGAPRAARSSWSAASCRRGTRTARSASSGAFVRPLDHAARSTTSPSASSSGAARSIPDFAIFVFTGPDRLGPLQRDRRRRGTASIVGNAGLIKKVYLPREIFPLSARRVGALQLRDPARHPRRRDGRARGSRPAPGSLYHPARSRSSRLRARARRCCCRRSTSTCATSSTSSRSS